MLHTDFPRHFKELKTLLSISPSETERQSLFLGQLLELSRGMIESAATRPAVQALLNEGADLASSALRFAGHLESLSGERKSLYQKSLEIFYAQAKRDVEGPPTLAEIRRCLIKLSFDLENMRLCFGSATGLTVDFLEGVPSPRKSKTANLNTAAVLLSIAWEVMMEIPTQYPNKFVKGGMFGTRPKYDDAYFVFLMLNLAAGVKDRTVAETAIKHALEIRKKMRAKPLAGISEELITSELRRKWEELKAQ